jgi:ribonuclease G
VEEEEEEEPERTGGGSGGDGRRRRRRRRSPANGNGNGNGNGGNGGGKSGGGGGGKSGGGGGRSAERSGGDKGESRGRGRGRSERGRRSGGGGSGSGRAPSRVSRSVPITEVVKEGDEVVVQISKEPIGTKGARVTSHVSLPGRYAVYLPTVDHVGISKRIGSTRERARLREVVEGLRPPSGGLIVRTVAEGLTKKGLKADIGYLVKLWEDVSKKRENAKSPTVLYTELDLVLKVARDLFTDEIENIVIDDKEEHARLVRFVEMFLPARVKDIQLYSGDEPIFDAYGIEDEISRALGRKVQLPSGGYLIIDQAEALTAIDVNTGRYVGKGSRDLEETALKTNLEAVEEIAYQLRFRNIGGLVILDLIDMDHSQNREKVWRALEQRLEKDKAKTTINRISELGLIEMTRKRTRESLSRMMHEPCFYCDGTGQIQSRNTIAYEILRQIRRERHSLPGYSVLVNAHPAIVDLMTGDEKEAVAEAERRYMRRIEFNARREYHIEQFDLQGK